MGSGAQGLRGSRVQEPLRGFQTLLRSVQGSYFVRSSIPAMRISKGNLFFEYCVAVLLEFLNAAGI
jgi:hypothetical protein